MLSFSKDFLANVTSRTFTSFHRQNFCEANCHIKNVHLLARSDCEANCHIKNVHLLAPFRSFVRTLDSVSLSWELLRNYWQFSPRMKRKSNVNGDINCLLLYPPENKQKNRTLTVFSENEAEVECEQRTNIKKNTSTSEPVNYLVIYISF